MTRLRGERGQTLVLTVVFLPALVGMAALVLDVGLWLREDRRAQAVADAAALAGAQLLPRNPAEAVRVALDYAARNGVLLSADDVAVQSDLDVNDEMHVEVERDVPGFFSRALGIDFVKVRARAGARTSPLAQARYGAPIIVDERHPKLQCRPEPCFDEPTELRLGKFDEPGSTGAGSFGLVDLSAAERGAPGAATLGEWTRSGFGGYVGPGSYPAAPGAEFNSTAMRAALTDRIGGELLLPVYRRLTGSGANAQFEVVGWVGFRLTGFAGSGNDGTVRGSFTRLTWEGVGAPQPSGTDFGAQTVALVS